MRRAPLPHEPYLEIEILGDVVDINDLTVIGLCTCISKKRSKGKG